MSYLYEKSDSKILNFRPEKISKKEVPKKYLTVYRIVVNKKLG